MLFWKVMAPDNIHWNPGRFAGVDSSRFGLCRCVRRPIVSLSFGVKPVVQLTCNLRKDQQLELRNTLDKVVVVQQRCDEGRLHLRPNCKWLVFHPSLARLSGALEVTLAKPNLVVGLKGVSTRADEFVKPNLCNINLNQVSRTWRPRSQAVER